MKIKIGFRGKFFIGFASFIIFYFLIFYPYIVPYMKENNVYPLIATAIFEALLYLTALLLSIAILGKDKIKTSFKFALGLFILYHIFDSVEPPFIVNANGYVDISAPTSIISWDYGLGYTIQQFTGFSWKTIYYVVNIFGILSMLLILALIFSPQALKDLVKSVYGIIKRKK